MNIKSNDVPCLIETETIDWSEIVFMIERKISGSELARHVRVTTQAVGSWRRGVQGPCLYTGIKLIFLVADLYMDKKLFEYQSADTYFKDLSDLLPRKGFTPWYPTNNHRKFKPVFSKPIASKISKPKITESPVKKTEDQMTLF